VTGKNSIYVMLTAVFAAVYTVGVVFLAPISFQLFQVRVADALLPLAMLFGWPVILGLSMGAFVANFFGGLGPIDIIGGALANFIATWTAWRIVQRRGRGWTFIGVGVEIAVITLIVGSYLSYLFGMPLTVGWLGVLLGSVVAIGILGSILLFALSTDRVVALLRPYIVNPKSRKQEHTAQEATSQTACEYQR
jgi:uncharacterized membrane protein